MQTILSWFFLINGLYMFRTFTCPSSGVLIYRLLHCRMWCYAIGVEAVVLRSWCVVLCTVCQLVSTNWQTVYIIIKLFASSWYIFLTYFQRFSFILFNPFFWNFRSYWFRISEKCLKGKGEIVTENGRVSFWTCILALVNSNLGKWL